LSADIGVGFFDSAVASRCVAVHVDHSLPKYFAFTSAHHGLWMT
jgi:hypothetical protein